MRFLVLALIIFCSAVTGAQPIGQKLPDFEFQKLSGQNIKLSELHQAAPNGTLMLTVWCTDCVSCRTSEKHLVDLIKEFDGKAKIVAVASSRNDNAEHVKQFLAKKKIDIPVLMDPSSSFAKHFNMTRTTTTVIVDKTGRVRYYGTLLRRKKTYGKDSLKAVVAGKIVGQPIGPNFG